MDLTEQQQDKIRVWASEGASIADIQSKVSEEFGIKLSYMDTRFLLLDIDAQLKDKPENEKAENAEDETSPDADDSFDKEDDYNTMPEDSEDGASEPVNGSVEVEISRIAHPGFALTGSVVFSDGVRAEWGITGDGRFSMESEKKGYRPTDMDLQAFQQQLRGLLSKQGF